MSDTFTILEAGATEMTRYEVPMILKPVVDAFLARQRNTLIINARQSGKTEMRRQWLKDAMKVDPIAAAQIKETKVPNGVREYEGTYGESVEALWFKTMADYAPSDAEAEQIAKDVEEQIGWMKP